MESVEVVEVSLRDGLQNESWILPAAKRVALATELAATGLKRIEAGSFVNSRWVPQMADSDLVLTELRNKQKSGYIPNDVRFSALVPNQHGMDDALKCGAQEIAIFAAASETFSKKNTNCTIEEGFARFAPVVEQALKNNIFVRGYVSTCFACPYEGVIDAHKVVEVANKLYELGCYEISIGDTIGVANVGQIESLFKKLKKVIPAKKLAGHFHDTRGQALANILQAYKMGITTFDSSIGGLGGCPYAKGATGNVATEDVVYMFDGLKVKSGLNLKKLIEINHWLNPLMNHPLSSKVGRVGLLKV